MKPCLLLLAALPFQASAFFVAPALSSSSRADAVVLSAARTNEAVSSRQQHLGNAFRSLTLVGLGTAAMLARGTATASAREKVEYLKEPTPEFEVRVGGFAGGKGWRSSTSRKGCCLFSFLKDNVHISDNASLSSPFLFC